MPGCRMRKSSRVFHLYRVNKVKNSGKRILSGPIGPDAVGYGRKARCADPGSSFITPVIRILPSFNHGYQKVCILSARFIFCIIKNNTIFAKNISFCTNEFTYAPIGVRRTCCD